MSGRRCRALAAGFEVRNGRVPNRTVWKDGGYFPSEWRRLKRGARHEASASTTRLISRAAAAADLRAKQRRKRARKVERPVVAGA